MKKITFERVEKEQPLQVRSNREQLIADIVSATTCIGEERKKLAARIALAANTLKWTDSDLHALLAKKKDPMIRSYTRFVWWSIKIK